MKRECQLTSKKGIIRKLYAYTYKFSEGASESEQIKILRRIKIDYYAISIREDSFTILGKLDFVFEGVSFFYRGEIDRSEFNTQELSLYIGKYLKRLFSKNYPQHLDENIFIAGESKVDIFSVLKGFEFRIQIFEDSTFFIHFVTSSKILIKKNNLLESVKKIQNQFSGGYTNQQTLFYVAKKAGEFYFKERRFLFDIELEQKLKERKIVNASFSLDFVKLYSTNASMKVSYLCKNITTDTFEFLGSVISNISSSENIEFEDDALLKKKYKSIPRGNNLVVGNNIRVDKLSKCYNHGVYNPVYNKIIIPVSVNGRLPEQFEKIFDKINGLGNVKFEKPISYRNLKQFVTDLETLNSVHEGALFTIFSDQLPQFLLDIFKKMGIRYAICNSTENSFVLSNFVTKCIKKLGGTINIIDNLSEPDYTYFLGIDVGHNVVSGNYSNLALVLLDNKGQLVAKSIARNRLRDESIDFNLFNLGVKNLFKKLQEKGRTYPSKIIVHRDGCLHFEDLQTIKKVLKRGYRVGNVDIVEIIKSTHPYVGVKEKNQFSNLESGDFILLKNSNALLITNTQGCDSFALKPIMIKHKYGASDFYKIIEQIYWLTNVGTNNLYNPTRLPATTNLANEFARTGRRGY